MSSGFEVSFHKELELPQVLEPNAVYFILNGDNVDTYLTDINGVPKNIGNTKMIQDVASDVAVVSPQPIEKDKKTFHKIDTSQDDWYYYGWIEVSDWKIVKVKVGNVNDMQEWSDQSVDYHIAWNGRYNGIYQ